MNFRACITLCVIPLAILAPSSRSPAAATTTQTSRQRGHAEVRLPPQLHFTATQYVDGSRAGLIGNGRTDNTDAFRHLLGQGNRTIHIRAGDYVTGKLVIPRNTVLLLDRGVIIRDSGKLGPNDRLISILDGNLYIRADGAKLLSNRQSYNGGEQRHGIFIYGASNVVIDGLQSDGNSGDGFYVGGPPGKPAENITIEYCGAFDNRRQGLSITSARNVRVEDSTFANTHGTPPAAGIDLEPNNANSWLDHVEIVNVRTESNSGGGILIVAPTLDGSPDRVNIDIVNHKSVGEGHRFTELGAGHLTQRIKYSGAR